MSIDITSVSHVQKAAPQRELTSLVLNTQRQFLNIVPEEVACFSRQNEGRGELGPTGRHVGGLVSWTCIQYVGINENRVDDVWEKRRR